MYSNDDYEQGYYDDYSNTMDSGMDSYERSYTKMPENVKHFLLNFRAAINDGAILDIQNMYENTFPQLSDHYFDKCSWPDEKEVMQLVEGDKLFMIFYKELYYRHIHARIPGGPTLSQRVTSFFNYCDFFNLILSASDPVLIELPDIWLWELVDEFVYQFQNFAQYRARSRDNANDNAVLNNSSNVWSILCILNVLHSLVDISNIKKQLEVATQGIDPQTVAGKFGSHSFYKMLGYFSLVGLLRVHSLLGDYYQAIKVLEPIEIHKKSQYSHIPACQISTSYYVGFAYMMMRRYTDAIRTFSGILLYIQRTKQLYSTRSYQNDQINKQTDQMYHLLAICLVLHPQYIDESIQQVLREKNYHDAMCKMQCGDLDTFKKFFISACPKFVSLQSTSTDPTEDYGKEQMEHQLQVFMDEVRQQKELPIIRSYLKLYTTLPLEKLASFMSQNSEQVDDRQIDNLLIHLLCFKHKMKNIVWSKGSSGLDGKFQSGSELDFYIDNDMIHIADTKVAHRYGDFFIRKILKFEDLNRRLHNINIK
ncbi:eukaryotic translation initiation factor 3 subunit L [Condylostylus longicornis]|uniref:eukaryotic translation initiation factor 3 subunit L n=1 Tax=Condylostylus longicornis TaxID=2530218 RepID=UPI00244DBBD5|nr:eukaryotic translation initiation factor 3 subunit L [Condylostylus longicornis]